MQEQRQCARWPLNRIVRYKTAEEDEFHQCESLDLSQKGIRIQLNEELYCNKPISLEICLHDQAKILATGRVVWQSELDSPGYFDAGLSFVNIKDIDKDKIFKYMISLSPEKFVERWWQGVK